MQQLAGGQYKLNSTFESWRTIQIGDLLAVIKERSYQLFEFVKATIFWKFLSKGDPLHK